MGILFAETWVLGSSNLIHMRVDTFEPYQSLLGTPRLCRVNIWDSSTQLYFVSCDSRSVHRKVRDPKTIDFQATHLARVPWFHHYLEDHRG